MRDLICDVINYTVLQALLWEIFIVYDQIV